MRIRFLMNVMNAHGRFRKGQEYDYPDRFVDSILDVGYAVPADEDGLDAIEFASKAARKLAEDEGLAVEDFAGHQPSGETGYTKDDVTEIVGDDEE